MHLLFFLLLTAASLVPSALGLTTRNLLDPRAATDSSQLGYYSPEWKRDLGQGYSGLFGRDDDLYDLAGLGRVNYARDIADMPSRLRKRTPEASETPTAGFQRDTYEDLVWRRGWAGAQADFNIAQQIVQQAIDRGKLLPPSESHIQVRSGPHVSKAKGFYCITVGQRSITNRNRIVTHHLAMPKPPEAPRFTGRDAYDPGKNGGIQRIPRIDNVPMVFRDPPAVPASKAPEAADTTAAKPEGDSHAHGGSIAPQVEPQGAPQGTGGKISFGFPSSSAPKRSRPDSSSDEPNPKRTKTERPSASEQSEGDKAPAAPSDPPTRPKLTFNMPSSARGRGHGGNQLFNPAPAFKVPEPESEHPAAGSSRDNLETSATAPQPKPVIAESSHQQSGSGSSQGLKRKAPSSFVPVQSPKRARFRRA